MNNIRLVKPRKAKSGNHVVNCLLSAMEEARHNKVLSVALVMQVQENKKTVTYTDYVLSPKSSYPDCIGGLERVKTEVMNRWLKND